MHRIGIDFGRTIGEVEQEYSDKTFNIIKMIVQKYKSENVFIISKAGQEMQAKIRTWLDKYDFCNICEFDENNIHFVKEYTDKRNMIIKYNIDVFIDDHYKVIQSIMDLKQVKYIIWFNSKADQNLIPKKYRSKIRITSKWAKIWNYKWNKN